VALREEDRPTRGLLDTSVYIAAESGRPLDRAALPDIAYVSAITAAELEVAVHLAPDPAVRSQRLRTWAEVTSNELLDADLGAAHEWSLIRSRMAGSGRRINVNDLWIAAIALANGLVVVTQDDDFDVFLDFGGPRIVKV